MPCNKLFLTLVFLTFSFSAMAVEPLVTRPMVSSADNATTISADNATTAQADNATAQVLSDPIESKEESPTTKEKSVTSDVQIKEGRTAPDPLKIISDLRTTLEIRKLQVALSSQDKLLREAMMPSATHLSKLSASSKTIKSKAKRKAPRPKVVAVQGVGGKLSAVLLTGNGFLTVYEGDKIGSGTVLSIAPDRVVVKYGRTETLLNFTE